MITGQKERQMQAQAHYADEHDEAILVDRNARPDYAVVIAGREMLHRWFGQGLVVDGMYWEVES